MNILPLVLVLVLALSVLTIERLEKFKNQVAVQKEYQTFLTERERSVFNKRQNHLFKISEKTHRQISFRYLLNKEEREKNENAAKESRQIAIDFIKAVYGETAFYKELERKRANFVEELVNAIQQAADEAPKGTIKRIEDISRLQLEDPELQEAFYRMLKGTLTHKELRTLQKEWEGKDVSTRVREKAYVSLLAYAHFNNQKISIQRSPREVLKAIFGNDEVVEAIILKRQEYAENKFSGAADAFKNEFVDKRKPGISDTLLNFDISESDKTDYN